MSSTLSKKRALITGINGQDGSYLTELLLSKDYEVFGICKRNTGYRTNRMVGGFASYLFLSRFRH